MSLLNDLNKLRRIREDGLDMLGTFSPKKAEAIDPFTTQTGDITLFGAGGKAPIGAKFGIEHMQGMYEGRSERYFDQGETDPRAAERYELCG
jgi:hypothetical protein